MVLIPFGLGYYLSYLYRTVNAVISPQLSAEIGLSATDLGLLTSVYFITFAAFQIPLGVLLDRYGPRRVQSVLLLVAALGGTLFAVSENFGLLIFARGCIGLGVSGCLMGALKANALWWPKARLPLVNGFTMAFGTFGAVSATVPVEMLSRLVGWRGIFVLLAGLSVVAAVLIFVVVPDRDTDAAPGRRGGRISDQFGEMRKIFGSAYFWRLGILMFVHNAAFLAYQALWMGPWLRDVAGMDEGEVARGLLAFNVGMFAGVLILGAVATALQRFGIRLITMIGFGVAVSIMAQTMFVFEATAFATPLCFVFGFFGSSTILVYALLSQSFPIDLVGRVNSAQNMLSFVAAFVAQWGIGAIIDRWPSASVGRFDPAGHQAAFMVMVALEILAFAWFLWARRFAEPPQS
jgi:predicted MFS family arabinose efflux permease